jgi:hypothetical protein
MLVLTAGGPPPPPDPVQVEFDRFVDLIADGMWPNGRVTAISAKPDASDEMLIAAAVHQLNQNPGPIKEWHILKKQHVGPAEFEAHLRKKFPDQFPPGISPGVDHSKYLITIIDSDQGQKIIGIAEYHGDNGNHWARMYNCDAVFSSPQEGGTPLIR